MSGQPTIKDVAKLAGVSIGTVDRVLHNRGKVSERNLRAVQQAITSLNYHPSQVARALSIQKKGLKIGASFPFVEHDFWTDACSGIEEAGNHLLKFGIEVIIDKYYSYDINEQKKSIERLLSYNVNGIAMTPSSDSASMLNNLLGNDYPYCTVIDDCPNSHRLFHVGPNDYALGALMGKLALLYRPDAKIAIIAPNISLVGTSQRISGFKDKLSELNQSERLITIEKVNGSREKHSYDNIYDQTLKTIAEYPEVNVIYVTNGLTQWAAAAVAASGRQSSIDVFGHEFTNLTREFIEEGKITAALYQKPANQWLYAIKRLAYILTDTPISQNASVISTECSIITKETLPLIQIGSII